MVIFDLTKSDYLAKIFCQYIMEAKLPLIHKKI